MSRMSEYAAEQENLSGLETEEQHWHEHNRKMLDGIGAITHGIEVEGVAHKQRMAQLSIAGFERIFTGERNGKICN